MSEPYSKLIDDLHERIAEVENAIRKHRDFRGDDRCYEDDAELYGVLPEGFSPPSCDTEIDLNQCAKYKACRQNPATEYVSPQRRIEELEAACKAAYRQMSGDYTDGGQHLDDRSVIALLLSVE